MKSNDPFSSVQFQVEELWEELQCDYRSSSYLSLDSSEDCRVFFRKLSLVLSTLLNIIRQNIHTSDVDEKPKWLSILDRMFRSIAYTRDILSGRGERQLTYLMLDVWYSFDPCLAVSALKGLLSMHHGPSCGAYGRSYGSFRDLIGLCDFIQHYSIRNLGQDVGEDPFFKTVVHMIDDQLSKDWSIYIMNGSGLGASADTVNTYSISNLAKWIPRENSKGDWLFSILVKHRYPHLSNIHSTRKYNTKYVFAFEKCKRSYRRIVSRLTRFLDVAEVKKCADQWDKIDVSTLPVKGLVSSWRSLEDHGLLNEIVVGYNADSSHSTRPPVSMMSGYYKNPTGVRELWVFVQEAKRLIDCSRSNLTAGISVKVNILNKKWASVVEGWKKHQAPYLSERETHVLPVISVDPLCPDHVLYQAIADACLMIEMSSLGRYILYAGDKPVWINLTSAVDFLSTLQTIFASILPRLGCNLQRTLDFVSTVLPSDPAIQLVTIDGKPVRKTYAEMCLILDHPRYFPMMKVFTSTVSF